MRTILQNALPNVTVKAITYPKYETKGDLLECVSRFRDWLQNQVIDLEVDAGTEHPTIDPSVHVVLVGHSMGGIVAAETLLAILGDEPIKSPSASKTEPFPSSTASTSSTSTSIPPANSTASASESQTIPEPPSPNFLFPYVMGVLAFDTPYLGISPGVLAYSAESHYNKASSVYSSLSSAASAFGFGGSASTAASSGAKSLTAGPEAAKEALNASADAAAVPSWTKYGRLAMFAGAGGAVVAGAAAAYMNRDSVKEGWGWVGSHLEFVGCLMRGEELKSRLRKVSDASQRRGIGFVNMYTLLGKGARKTEGKSVAGGWFEVGMGGGSGSGDGNGRTFCALPKRDEFKGYFEPCLNDKVAGEIDAHVSMFNPPDNPGYYAMADKARNTIANWMDHNWYAVSQPDLKSQEAAAAAAAGTEDEPVLVD